MKEVRGFASIGLYSPKREENIGGVLRAAWCYEVSVVVAQGARFRRLAEDTPVAWRHIPCLHVPDLFDARPFGSKAVVVECVDGAVSLPSFVHPQSAFYIFGPEDGSVLLEMIEAADHVVRIPTRNCMNLAATVNVVLYDRMAKMARSGNAV